MDSIPDNPSFLDLMKLSLDALAHLRDARELFLQSQAEPNVTESLRLQMQAISIQTKALQLLKESDRLMLARLDRQKAEIEKQKAYIKSQEKPAPQD